MLYESEPSIARHPGQSGHMVNGKSPISLKRLRSRLALPRSRRRRPGLAYSSLPREIAIEASVFVLLQRISRRR